MIHKNYYLHMCVCVLGYMLYIQSNIIIRYATCSACSPHKNAIAASFFFRYPHAYGRTRSLMRESNEQKNNDNMKKIAVKFLQKKKTRIIIVRIGKKKILDNRKKIVYIMMMCTRMCIGIKIYCIFLTCSTHTMLHT